MCMELEVNTCGRIRTEVLAPDPRDVCHHGADVGVTATHCVCVGILGRVSGLQVRLYQIDMSRQKGPRGHCDGSESSSFVYCRSLLSSPKNLKKRSTRLYKYGGDKMGAPLPGEDGKQPREEHSASLYLPASLSFSTHSTCLW